MDNVEGSILVYVGANQGFGITDVLYKEKFDNVICFEPDSQMYSLLCNNISSGLLSKISYDVQFHTFNVACSSETGNGDLYIFDNRVSTSLATANYDKDKSRVVNVVNVQTVNLCDFLMLNKINHIDYLITDCQGSDFNILKTLEPYIKEQKIDRICHETHRDDFTPYSGLENHFHKFADLLMDYYTIEYFKCDGINRPASDIITELEWDTFWKKK